MPATTPHAARLVLLALALALVQPAGAQRPDMSGTWELADTLSQLTFERAGDRTAAPLPCDPDEALIRVLGLLAPFPQRFTVTQTDDEVVITRGGTASTFHADGRAEKNSMGGIEFSQRAHWDTRGVLVIEWKPAFGGTMLETYTAPGSQPFLQVSQTIEHPVLSQPARQRLTFRRVAEPQGQRGRAGGQPPAAAGQVADTDFRPAIERPAFQPQTGPLVLIDEAHANFHIATGRYLPFAELLRRDGYVVKGSADRLTPEVLRAAGVIVVANAREPFAADEVTAVRDWVARGGSLLLITDHPPFVEAATDLAAAFAIRLRSAAAQDPGLSGGRLTFRRSDGTLKDHPITHGIDEVVTFTGSSFEIEPPGQPLLVFGRTVCAYTHAFDLHPLPLEGHLQGAVVRFDLGRVAAFGEAAMFSAQVSGPNRSPMGMNAPVAKQNAQFLLNVIHWLTGLN
jgi:hypothetical protein